MNGKGAAFAIASLLLILSVAVLQPLDSDDVLSSDPDPSWDTPLDADLIWDQAIANANDGLNPMRISPGEGSLDVKIGLRNAVAPQKLYAVFLDDPSLKDLKQTVDAEVSTEAVDGSSIITLSFSDIGQLPSVCIVILSDTEDPDDCEFSLSFEVFLADIVITKGVRGEIEVYRHIGGRAGDVDLCNWEHESFASNSDLVVSDLSGASRQVDIIYSGPAAKDLALFNADTKASLNAAVDVSFIFVSGSIQTVRILIVQDDVKDTLGTSYDVMSTPIHNAHVEVLGGTVGLISPTSDMVSVTNYDLLVSGDSKVSKVFTTGENGKYSNVQVTVTGGRIGYMTNVASKIGTLSYDIRSGAVDYFCVGANTEHAIGKTIGTMFTSYVSGDVYVTVESSASVGKCILGGGILSVPKILCNGETITDPIVHSLMVDAPGVTVYNDIAFLTESRTNAYHFTNYSIGQTPSVGALMDTITCGEDTIKVYSEDGVWTSISSCSIPVGSIVSLNTDFYIAPDGSFVIEKGGRVYNTQSILLSGMLSIEGDMINNSVIQCRTDSVLEGTVQGIGFLADYVRYTNPNPSLNVISKRTAVVIDQGRSAPVENISAVLTDDHRSVSIMVEGSQRIFGDQFMLSLQDEVPPEEFDQAYRLDIMGIDANVLGLCVVEIVIPINTTSSTGIYVWDSDANRYSLIATSENERDIKILAGTQKEFFVGNYSDSPPDVGPDKPDVDPSKPIIVINTEMTTLDYFLLAAIIGVLAVTIYAILTMKRD